METNRLTLSQKAARLLASNPGMTYREAMAELQRRSTLVRAANKRRKNYGVTPVFPAFAADTVESPKAWYWDR